MNPLVVSAAALGVLAFSLALRFKALSLKADLEVDNWYWLLCAEDVRRRRRLPARLPYFLLEEEEQWYPPLYSAFLALFPGRFLQRWGGHLAQVQDMLYGLAIFVGVYLAGGGLLVASLSALSFAIAYLPLSYNMQLQPRSLANLLLAGTMLSVWRYLASGALVWWLAALAGVGTLLFLHKMTAQMMVVYGTAAALVFRSAPVAALLPAAMLLALGVSGGFYLKMLRAHWDIVTFWHENIGWIGSHQYYESPRYRKAGHRTTAFHQPGWRGLLRKARDLLYANPFALLLPVLMGAALNQVQGRLWPLEASPFQRFLWLWLLATYGWALATTYIPPATALGAGVYYVYHSFLPLFVLVATYLGSLGLPGQLAILGLWGVGALLSLRRIARFYRSIPVSTPSDGLRPVLDHLRQLPGQRVFCIPFTLPDITAYVTRKQVFWGGHSYGFHRLLKPYFPVMKADVQETLAVWHLDYVLFWRRYLDHMEEIGLVEGRDVTLLCEHGEYALYEVLPHD